MSNLINTIRRNSEPDQDINASAVPIITTPKSTGTKKVFFTISDKGGVGKTILARALLDYLITKGESVVAFDTDKSVGQLKQYYENHSPRVVFDFNIRDEVESLNLIDVLDGIGDTQYVIFDLPGGALYNLLRIDKNATTCAFITEAMAKRGYELNLLVPITPFSASIHSVRKLIGQFGPNARYHVFKQIAFIQGSRKVFELWETVPSYQEGELERDFAIANGANIYEMPEMAANIMARIDLCNVPFSVATDMPPNKYWSSTYQGNVSTWVHKVKHIFDQIV
jgi:hypothetical protein